MRCYDVRASVYVHCRRCRHLQRVYKKSESKWCWDFGVREAQRSVYAERGLFGVWMERVRRVGWLGAKGHQCCRLYYGLLRKGGGLGLMMMEFFFVEMGKMAAQYTRRQGLAQQK